MFGYGKKLWETVRAWTGFGLDATGKEQLRQRLFALDFHPQAVQKMLQSVEGVSQQTQIIARWKELWSTQLTFPAKPWQLAAQHTLLFVGTNGQGKTTSLAKCGYWAQQYGASPLFAACDTTRAAGSTQLGLWAKKLGLPVVEGQQGGDPAAVCFDACHAAQKRSASPLLVDTAGRIHTQSTWIAQLQKIRTVCEKHYPQAPCDIWLAIDATMGSNSLAQVAAFSHYLTGLVLTKVDLAPTGAIFTASTTYQLPIRFIGTGERAQDWQLFDAKKYVASLFDPN